MASKALILGLLAETHVHVGVGQSTEVLDLPVAREKITHWPFIPGSGVKGAFRVWAKEQAELDETQVESLFGKADEAGSDGNAGSLLFSDARLLLLPVRALNKAWRWVISSDLLRRYQRDLERAGQTAGFSIPQVNKGKWLGDGDGWLGLEEREFSHAGAVDGQVIEALATIAGESEALIRERLVILNDDDFVWFARYGLPIMARNALDENKRVKKGALWYEEALAPDTVMYLLVGERSDGATERLSGALNRASHIQMGGNETIGQGWFRINELDGGGDGKEA